VFEFAIPKFATLLLAVFIPTEWGWLVVVASLSLVSEVIHLNLDVLRQLSEGFTVVRAKRSLLLRLGFGVGWVGMFLILFLLLPLQLALPLGIIGLVGMLAPYLWLLLWHQIMDMRGTAPRNHQFLFEQVRRFQNLNATITSLKSDLLIVDNSDDRRGLRFYLGWAETYCGHLLADKSAWNQAIKRYRVALSYDPANLSARSMLAVCLSKQGKFETAVLELKNSVNTFTGSHKNYMGYDEGLWHWHRNEVSSEYEQKAGLVQLCTLILGLLQAGNVSNALEKKLNLEIRKICTSFSNTEQGELDRIMALKGGRPLGALALVCSGPYRKPANPLGLLEAVLTLPLIYSQLVESVTKINLGK
jgi:hypothetical protein